MNERGSKLGISQAIIDSVSNNAEPLVGDLSPYIRKVMLRISDEQPLLYAYLTSQPKKRGIQNEYAYASSIAFTYDMLSASLPDEKRKKPITDSVLGTLSQNLEDYLVDLETPKPSLDLTWFINKLEKDSPAIIEWMADMIDVLDGNTKKDFILGAIFVTMPFYMMREAEELEERYFGDST